MSKISLIKGSCALENVDAVVNAANNMLRGGSGICGVIFNNCGYKELTLECGKYETPLKDGSAVITGSYNMKNCKAIIHAVGPDFRIRNDAFEELYEAYYNSLVVLKDNNYHSISFPLISSGIFSGNLNKPAYESAKQCLRAYNKFIKDYEYDIDVRLCCFTDNEYNEVKELF